MQENEKKKKSEEAAKRRKKLIALLFLLIAGFLANYFLYGKDAENSNGESKGAKADITTALQDSEAGSFNGGTKGQKTDAALTILPEVTKIAQGTDEKEVQTTSAAETTAQVTEEAEKETEPVRQEILYYFRKDEYLEQHFKKHGNEFPYATKEEYLEGANRVVQSEDALHKTEQEDGDDIYYIEETNEFVVVSQDGYIRTYFKPSAGIDYYNRQ